MCSDTVHMAAAHFFSHHANQVLFFFFNNITIGMCDKNSSSHQSKYGNIIRDFSILIFRKTKEII